VKRIWAVIPLLCVLISCTTPRQTTASGNPSPSPTNSSVPSTPSSEPSPQDSLDTRGDIEETDSGKTFSFRETERFSVYLDAKRFPLGSMDTSNCNFFGYISNLSTSGPDNYPIGYEITGQGSCVLRNGAFHVKIVGVRLND
jgi:hypothetical protein